MQPNYFCPTIAKEMFPHMAGMQTPLLCQTLTFEVCTAEILEPYHHWNLVSTIGCKENHFELYDSLYSSNIASDTAASNASLLHSSSDTVEVKIMDVQKKSKRLGLWSIVNSIYDCGSPTGHRFLELDVCFLNWSSSRMVPGRSAC